MRDQGVGDGEYEQGDDEEDGVEEEVVGALVVQAGPVLATLVVACYSNSFFLQKIKTHFLLKYK